MNSYVDWVSGHPFQSAAIQFALLGTLGEVVAASLRARKIVLPCTRFQLFLKALAWSLLGLVIKGGFVGMKGFTQALVANGMLPAFCGEGIGRALALSVLTNLFFGPQMMAFHRWEDNLILGQRGYKGIERAWATLVWFWIPAHTVTFALSPEFQIGLAAVWGLVLGVILGLSKDAAPSAGPH